MTRALAALFLALSTTTARADDAKKAEPAADVLAAALAKAKADGKAVFLAFGSPSCGWCKYLDKYHARPGVEKVLGKHLVFAKVDIVDNPGGKDLYEKYAPKGGGVPVWVVLSAGGEVLADSFAGGEKNVGFPYDPDEVAHYEKAMRKAVPKLSADELAGLVTELKAAGPEKKK